LAGPVAAAGLELTIDGGVTHPMPFTVAELEKPPAVEEEVAADRSGATRVRYTGVRLWTLLEACGGLADPQRRAVLRHTMSVTGRDGYWLVLSLGELDPGLGDSGALIAYRRDGEAPDAAHGLRLILPKDKHGARNVADVVRIEVK
jgi:DMSO/TMAO reductase YedYZ molybdopterin-dependent catalytic subunit